MPSFARLGKRKKGGDAGVLFQRSRDRLIKKKIKSTATQKKKRVHCDNIYKYVLIFIYCIS